MDVVEMAVAVVIDPAGLLAKRPLVLYHAAMGNGSVWVAASLLGVWLCASCGSEGPAPSTIELVRGFHDRILTVDSACRASLNLVRVDWRADIRHKGHGPGTGRFDLPRMKSGGLDVAFFLVPIHQGDPTEEGFERARRSAVAGIEAVARMTADHPDLIALALAPEHAYRAEKQGRSSAYLGVENGYVIGRDLSFLAELFARGVRLLTLCGDRDNFICDAASDKSSPDDRGLSAFGHRVIAECNRLGIIIDLANASERSFFDAVTASRAPVVVSHGAARALCDRPENLTDEMIQAVAAKGGVIQVCLAPELLVPAGARRRARLADVIAHLDHVKAIGGVSSVGIGTDFDGGGGLTGCQDIGEIPNLTLEILKRGYKEYDAEAIWGGNIMRVFREIGRVAEAR